MCLTGLTNRSQQAGGMDPVNTDSGKLPTLASTALPPVLQCFSQLQASQVPAEPTERWVTLRTGGSFPPASRGASQARPTGVEVAGFQRLVARGDGWPEVATGGFEAGERRAFTRTMAAHEGLGEIQVGQLTRLGVERAHRERLLEGVSDFGFVRFLYPGEDGG